MYFEHRNRNGITILECYGRFDEGDTNQFFQTIEQLHAQGKNKVIINLTPVYFLDPQIANLFLFADDFLGSHGGHLHLVTPLISSVRNELTRSKIIDKVPTFETLYNAFHRPHSPFVRV